MPKIYGPENVFDFSIGNPSVAPPEQIRKAIIDIAQEENPLQLHGYMNNSGYEEVRQAIAEHLNAQHGCALSCRDIVMTCGAAGGLNVILKTLLNPGDEVIVLAPFFSEYANYIANYDGRMVVVSTDPGHLPARFKPSGGGHHRQDQSRHPQHPEQSDRRHLFSRNPLGDGGAVCPQGAAV